jgi:hypothetical protein
LNLLALICFALDVGRMTSNILRGSDGAFGAYPERWHPGAHPVYPARAPIVRIYHP